MFITRITRRAFLGGLAVGATILGGVARAHHKPGHTPGPKPKPTPTPSPSPSPTPPPVLVGIYSASYGEVY